MKKILMILLLCFYMTNVNALTYSEYSEYSDYTDEVIESDDLTDVKIERRYKYYKFIKELGPYEEKEALNEKYPLTDYDDYIYTDESNYLSIKPDEKDGRVINTYSMYQYKKAKDISYVDFICSNYNASNFLNISDISIMYKNSSIDYTLEFNNATIDKINASGYIRFNFNKDISLDDLSISLKGTSKDTLTFIIETGNKDKVFSSNKWYFSGGESMDVSYTGSSVRLIGDFYDYYYDTQFIRSSGHLTNLGRSTVYTYKDILYRKYAFVKEYYPLYLKEAIDDYIYQDSDYKDYYAFRTRSIIEDEIELPPLVSDQEVLDSDSVIDRLLKIEEKESIEATGKKEKVLNSNREIKTENKNDTSFTVSPLLNTYDNAFSGYKVMDSDISNDEPHKFSFKFFLFPLILLGILILVLSKLYKKKK